MRSPIPHVQQGRHAVDLRHVEGENVDSKVNSSNRTTIQLFIWQSEGEDALELLRHYLKDQLILPQ